MQTPVGLCWGAGPRANNFRRQGSRDLGPHRWRSPRRWPPFPKMDPNVIHTAGIVRDSHPFFGAGSCQVSGEWMWLPASRFRVPVTGGCVGRGTESRTTFYPCRKHRRCLEHPISWAGISRRRGVGPGPVAKASFHESQPSSKAMYSTGCSFVPTGRLKCRRRFAGIVKLLGKKLVNQSISET